MNAIIILFSYHHKNTEKIAQVISSIIGAEIKTPDQVDPTTLSNYDLVGFGSGVYFGKLHKVLLEFADRIPQVSNKKAFIISTSGQTGKMTKFHKQLREKLQGKGFDIV
ncbi:MAG: flavodoxin domain-containing protein, partial [Candidatus Bathyarchaeia archaeon]